MKKKDKKERTGKKEKRMMEKTGKPKPLSKKERHERRMRKHQRGLEKEK